jgi:hypothetical protein
VADAILLVLPIRLITSVTTPFAQRRLLLCVFSASVLTTLTSIVHAYYLIRVAGLVEGLTANVEVRRRASTPRAVALTPRPHRRPSR